MNEVILPVYYVDLSFVPSGFVYFMAIYIMLDFFI
jgi:hypothetical protein